MEFANNVNQLYHVSVFKDFPYCYIPSVERYILNLNSESIFFMDTKVFEPMIDK